MDVEKFVNEIKETEAKALAAEKRALTAEKKAEELEKALKQLAKKDGEQQVKLDQLNKMIAAASAILSGHNQAVEIKKS